MKEIKLQDLLSRILCADAKEMHLILDAVSERFSEVFPESTLMTISAPGCDVDAQISELRKAIDLLSDLKSNDLP